MSTRRRRHTPEQIIRELAEGHRLLAAGKPLDEFCRHLEISESTWHRWLAQNGGMKANDTKRLKELEGENARLKKLLAAAELDKAMLRELSEGNCRPPRGRDHLEAVLATRMGPPASQLWDHLRGARS